MLELHYNFWWLSGSLQEREVYERAKHHNELQQKGQEPGLKVKIKVSPDMDIGADFDVFAVIANNTEADKTCRVMFYARIVSYDGKPGANCGFIEDLTMEVPTGKGQVSFVLLRAIYSISQKHGMYVFLTLLSSDL